MPPSPSARRADPGSAPAQPHSDAWPAAKEAQAANQTQTYTITELAQEFEITTRAIRFYEDLGLLQPAREGRNRVYNHRDRTRLKLTLRGKRLGLPLQSVKQLIDMYESESDTRPQLEAFVLALADHRRLLEQQLDDIRVSLAEIDLHESRCRELLAADSPSLNFP